MKLVEHVARLAILPECVESNAQSMVQVPEDPVAQELILETEHIFSKFPTLFQIHLLGQPATHPVQQLLRHLKYIQCFQWSPDPNRSPSVMINNHPVPMELDMGASVSVISESTYNTVLKDTVPLESTDISLHTYMGEELPVLGVTTVAISYESQTTFLPLVVVKGDRASLFGRNWLEHIKLNWLVIHKVSNNWEVDDLLQKHQQLFHEELGMLKGMEDKIHVPPNAQPHYFKPRPLAYSLKAKVEKELDWLQEAGVIRPVQFSDWAAPIVPIVKADGSIHICGDYNVTVNAVSKLDNYPLPRVDDLFTAMSGWKVFLKLDLTHAYQQVLLSEKLKKYTIINTTKGLF